MVELFSPALALDAHQTTGGSPDDLFVYAFTRDDGRQLVVAWTKATDQSVEISVAHPATRAIEHHFDGSTTPYSMFGGRTLSEVALHPGTARLFELLP